MGSGTHVATVSDNPTGTAMPPIGAWLSKPLTPLSARAARGFLKRAAQGSLRFPHGFLDAVADHAARLEARGGAQPSLFA